MPYKHIEVHGAEADDIIATLVRQYPDEKVMIVSGDKDFIQLHKYDNVDQYSYVTRKEVSDPNPRLYLQTQILKGDSIDGVPNVLSSDNTFVEGIRQTPLRKKKIEEILADLSDGELLYSLDYKYRVDIYFFLFRKLFFLFTPRDPLQKVNPICLSYLYT